MHPGDDEPGDSNHFVDGDSHGPHTLRYGCREAAARSLSRQAGFQNGFFGVNFSNYAAADNVLRVRAGAGNSRSRDARTTFTVGAGGRTGCERVEVRRYSVMLAPVATIKAKIRTAINRLFILFPP